MIPKDLNLYDIAKKKADDIYKKPSAYKSGYIVKLYKNLYTEKYGDNDAYIGPKQPTKGLSRWFAEDWRNQRGEIGYSKEGDIYRPTKRITEDTPVTIQELTPQQIKAAQLQKKKIGRVDLFKK